ncbi:MAG: hypothetical protein ACK5QT_09315 [Oligoflexia bacterium]|jgi:hypothetical protein
MNQIALWLLIGFLSSPAFAIDLLREGSSFVGKVYSLDARRELLLDLDRKMVGDGRTAQALFQDLAGKPLVTELTTYESADPSTAVTAYEVLHHQAGWRGRVEVKGSKLVFSKWKLSPEGQALGQPTVEEEDWVANWAVGPSIVSILGKRWNEVLSGKTVSVRFAVLDRQETVGFDLFKDRVERASDGTEQVVIKMKPSSFLIAAIVDPVFFAFGRDGLSLHWVKGRILPMRQEGSKLKNLDAEVVYLSRPARK